MESAIEVRKVAQDVLMFVLHKHRIILKEPSPDLRFIPNITSELMNNLSHSVWMQSILNDCIWGGFFQKHFKRMTRTFKLFIKYVSFACYAWNEDNANGHESFCDTLSIVVYFALRCREAGSKVFLNTCVDFFCAFFEKEIRTKFEHQGGWENFNEYVVNELDSVSCTGMIEANIHSFEHFYQFEDSEDIKENFTSYYIECLKYTQTHVENNEEAVSFAESIAGKMGELYQKTFEEVLADFAKTDIQVEEIYRRTMGKKSGGLTKQVEYSSPAKVQDTPENVPSNSKPEKKETGGENSGGLTRQVEDLSPGKVQETPENISGKTTSEKQELEKFSDSLDTQNSDNINLSKVDVRKKESSQLSPKSEKARKLLRNISRDISKLYELIQSLRDKYGMQVSA